MPKPHEPRWLYDIENPDIAQVEYAERAALRANQFATAAKPGSVLVFEVTNGAITPDRLAILRANASAFRVANYLECVAADDDGRDALIMEFGPVSRTKPSACHSPSL